MKTKFVKANMKYYCIEDKKRYASDELVNRCGSCTINRCNAARPIERLKDRGLI